MPQARKIYDTNAIRTRDSEELVLDRQIAPIIFVSFGLLLRTDEMAPRFLRRPSSAAASAGMSERSQGTALPMLRFPDTTRNNIVAMLGEFVGTFLFLFGSFVGTQIANTPLAASDQPPNHAALIFVALAFGVSLTANVWAFYRVTGGLFNPAVCAPFYETSSLNMSN